ncbi:hypothetical protein PT974_09499 [Cladobotryum mycophilum]|uniref:Uncharacterized protein n=1 Tax=Cladobotryum mycophilum TaxID=491253 RepID=A0ABR0SHP9_9HYPO
MALVDVHVPDANQQTVIRSAFNEASFTVIDIQGYLMSTTGGEVYTNHAYSSRSFSTHSLTAILDPTSHLMTPERNRANVVKRNNVR